MARYTRTGQQIEHLLAYKIVRTLLPSKLLSFVSPSRHLGGCEERMLRRSQTGQAWLELQIEPLN